MGSSFEREPMLDLFIFETTQLIEQLEQLILNSEQGNGFDSSINEIFRIMHTIKGSSAMMLFNNISNLAHAIEDLFYFLREEKPSQVDYMKLSDLVLAGVDFTKNEINKLQNGEEPDGDSSGLIQTIKEFLATLKSDASGAPPENKNDTKKAESQKFYIGSDQNAEKKDNQNRFRIELCFMEGCEMEDVRAFTLLYQLKEKAEVVETSPEVIIDDQDTIGEIRKNGLHILIQSQLTPEELRDFLNKTPFLKEVTILPDIDTPAISKIQKDASSNDTGNSHPNETKHGGEAEKNHVLNSVTQKFINVNVDKLDKLMDLVAELVIAEAMVTHHPELENLPLENYHKASGQLRKITNELQDIVMSIRMVPLTNTFLKMQRIVRDMSHKLNKDVELALIGEETEVDKNIIENLSDPLMHLIRNSIDHGIEPPNERLAKGKPETAKITLEAKNSGNEVWIIVQDDGRGLNKEKILAKAQENGLVFKPESELTDREIYSFILLPGFSTKEKVTEFSGRGVGMDVVVKNIEKVGGTVFIDSTPGMGTVISLKIPLTLAIINGMSIQVGESLFTVPTTTIRESFRVKSEDIIHDPDGNEMILLRGQCHPILRLHQFYKIPTVVEELSEGIIVMVENDQKVICLFADQLLGEQQVVVKNLPRYIKKVSGVAGCTLLGDGSISLILDVAGFLHY
ncbi:two-component system chemotaxis sensor kinase CheA [Hydrogenispora ethanolica]|uniref:Chemotaxis protein CheA n=1 Tax=Hydrogenispora ethanolica TaxID=1082276 RepID=A0A4R1RFR7_HYDET|nr:chemotaxis protein CheA [Hydrogenispora ethanolica]TCL64766.1 two-component system chemotaxis sensor kinase CheA [Hydrogenispora ethanolica]